MTSQLSPWWHPTRWWSPNPPLIWAKKSSNLSGSRSLLLPSRPLRGDSQRERRRVVENMLSHPPDKIWLGFSRNPCATKHGRCKCSLPSLGSSDHRHETTQKFRDCTRFGQTKGQSFLTHETMHSAEWSSWFMPIWIIKMCGYIFWWSMWLAGNASLYGWRPIQKRSFCCHVWLPEGKLV